MSRRGKFGLLVLGLLVVLVVMPLTLLKRNGSTPAGKPVVTRLDYIVLEPGGGGGICLHGESRKDCRARFAKK